jgi:hypothetical protein
MTPARENEGLRECIRFIKVLGPGRHETGIG